MENKETSGINSSANTLEEQPGTYNVGPPGRLFRELCAMGTVIVVPSHIKRSTGGPVPPSKPVSGPAKSDASSTAGIPSVDAPADADPTPALGPNRAGGAC